MVSFIAEGSQLISPVTVASWYPFKNALLAETSEGGLSRVATCTAARECHLPSAG